MFDYSKSPNFVIENVDYEIHVLGVRPVIMMWGMFIFLGNLIINPFWAIIITTVFMTTARQFYVADMQGNPIFYRKSFLKFCEKYKSLAKLIPSIESIHIPLEVYRE